MTFVIDFLVNHCFKTHYPNAILYWLNLLLFSILFLSSIKRELISKKKKKIIINMMVICVLTSLLYAFITGFNNILPTYLFCIIDPIMIIAVFVYLIDLLNITEKKKLLTNSAFMIFCFTMLYLAIRFPYLLISDKYNQQFKNQESLIRVVINIATLSYYILLSCYLFVLTWKPRHETD